MQHKLDNWAPKMLSVLRIIAGFLFLQAGTMKILAFPMALQGVPDPLPTLLVVAGYLELVGGALLMFGVFTRPVAFILSGQMAVAYFIGHFAFTEFGLWPSTNGGTPAVLYSFLFLYFAIVGGGPWSLDRLIWKKGHVVAE